MTLIQMLKMGEILEIPDPDTDPSGYLKKLTQLTLICDKERISKVTDTRFKRKTFDYQKAISDATKVVKYLRELSPVWKELLSGERKFTF